MIPISIQIVTYMIDRFMILELQNFAGCYPKRMYINNIAYGIYKPVILPDDFTATNAHILNNIEEWANDYCFCYMEETSHPLFKPVSMVKHTHEVEAYCFGDGFLILILPVANAEGEIIDEFLLLHMHHYEILSMFGLFHKQYNLIEILEGNAPKYTKLYMEEYFLN